MCWLSTGCGDLSHHFFVRFVFFVVKAFGEAFFRCRESLLGSDLLSNPGERARPGQKREPPMLSITPFLWYDTQAEEAMNFYASIFKRSKIISVNKVGGRAIGVEFELEGQRFMALNGGPKYKLNESYSMFVSCDTQAEIDDLWEK